MKSLFALLAFAPLMAMAKTSTPAGFTDNMDEALASAKANGKYVYACFSGSDWCGWCVKLEKEVFSKPEFLSGVTNDYELVFIDSPSKQEVLSERAKVENPKLTKKYNIHGFPTALILNGEGEVLAQTGYKAGGPRKYVKHLKALKKNAVEIKRLQAEVERLERRIDELENEE